MIQIPELCRSFAGVTEDVKWEDDLCFCVGGKIFAVLSEGEQGTALCVKAEPAEFEALIQMEGVIPAPYLGRYKWVQFLDTAAAPPQLLKDLIHSSYRLVFARLPAKVRKNLEEN